MSQFYGTIDGQSRTTATRRGSKASGIVTHAASWDGAVRVTVHDRGGVDWATVELVPWHGAGTHRVLYDGPVSGEDAKAIA